MQTRFLRVIEAIDFLPLTLFIVLYKTKATWQTNFIVTGQVALFFLVVHFVFLKKKFATPLLIGVNLFLFGGFLMAFFEIRWLVFLYKNLKQATLFLSIVIVGVAATIFEPHVFVGGRDIALKRARRLSVLMVAGSIAATIFSWLFRGDFFYAGYLPFFSLLFFRDLLQVRDYGFQKKLLNACVVNGSVLLISFLAKNVIGKNMFVAIVFLLVGKKLFWYSLKKFFV